MKFFRLERSEDVSGVSGTGCVAQGVVFDDGTVALRWLTQYASTAIYDSIETAEKIHGHNGSTKLVFAEQTTDQSNPDCMCCGHPVKDHWGDNCGACEHGNCLCVAMNHGHLRCTRRGYGEESEP